MRRKGRKRRSIQLLGFINTNRKMNNPLTQMYQSAWYSPCSPPKNTGRQNRLLHCSIPDFPHASGLPMRYSWLVLEKNTSTIKFCVLLVINSTRL